MVAPMLSTYKPIMNNSTAGNYEGRMTDRRVSTSLRLLNGLSSFHAQKPGDFKVA